MKLRLLTATLFVMGFVTFVGVVEAHQSGCHRWHSCPSDTGSYTCGDLGYSCQYPTYTSPSSSSYTYTPSYTYTTNCPLNSYPSGSSCQCNYGYVVSGDQCISGNSYCSAKIGLMSNYNSLSKSCECMAGYEIGISGTCTYKSTYSYSPSYTKSPYDYSGYFDTSANTCPKHSSVSITESDSCTCDIGYKPNLKKNSCVKITKKDNDKQCRASFKRNSEWNGDYDEEKNVPYCSCKKGFGWNSNQTSCIKD